jgi:AraC family transcriptional regulator, regulatory protein of adaptative response / methylated-DNA-[protein]-cysteine methyltransferase
MTEIALAAGFGSLRRFNTVFAEVYKRPPTAIRRVRRMDGVAGSRA